MFPMRKSFDCTVTERYRFPRDFAGPTFMLFGQSEGQVTEPLANTVAPLYENPVESPCRSVLSVPCCGHRYVRFACSETAVPVPPDETDPLQVSHNVRQHVLDFPDNDTRNEYSLYRRHSDRIFRPCSRIPIVSLIDSSIPFTKHSTFFTFWLENCYTSRSFPFDALLRTPLIFSDNFQLHINIIYLC